MDGIMYAQIILDKPPERVLTVLTLNQEGTMKPQEIAQYKKAGRGYLITRNSATLADTDYEHVAKEITSALNDRKRMVEALREAMHQVSDAGACRAIQNLLVDLGEIR
jgi:hypothetical protein